jgi:hypothetical protein
VNAICCQAATSASWLAAKVVNLSNLGLFCVPWPRLMCFDHPSISAPSLTTRKIAWVLVRCALRPLSALFSPYLGENVSHWLSILVYHHIIDSLWIDMPNCRPAIVSTVLAHGSP